MGELSHTGFVMLSYGLTGVVIAGLLLWIVVTGRRRQAHLSSLAREDEQDDA